MRLLKVEMTRLRWRRAVVVLLAGCFLIPAVIWAGTAWSTRPVSDADLQLAEEQVQAELQQPYVQREIRRCTNRPERFGVAGAEDVEAACTEAMGPSVDWFLYRPQLDVAEQRRGTGVGVVSVLVGLLMVLGTTFAGHDWNSGSMSNQLLFEPRRLRVWGAKALAVLLVGLVTATVVLTAFWGAIWLLAESRDVQGSAATWELVRESAVRAVPLAALAGVGGYALTMLLRSTVATLGIMFAFTVAGSLLMVAVLGENAERWLLPVNLAAWLLGGVKVGGYCDDPFGDCVRETLTVTDAGVYFGVLLTVAAALSAWSFRRRDVP